MAIHTDSDCHFGSSIVIDLADCFGIGFISNLS